jgi:integrase
MGYIKEIGDGKWTLVAEAGKDPATGKRKRIRRTFYGGKRAAEKELLKLESSIMEGTWQEPTNMTVGKYLELWLEQHSTAKDLRPATVEVYQFFINKYIIPSLGAIPLDQLHSFHIQNFVTQLRKRKKEKYKKGETLSPRTVTATVEMLRLALKHAVKKWKLLKENPAEEIETPGYGEPRRSALSAENMFKLLDYCYEYDREYYPLYYTAFFTGMRRGELLGLHWNEVNLKEGFLEIKWTLQPVLNKGLVFRPAPKTKAGFRIVELSSTVVTLLTELKKKQNEIKLFMGEDYYQEHDLVFCHPDGRPYHPCRVSARFHALATQAGFPELRFHDMRHTHATLMLDMGIDLRAVQRRLGHQKPSTTINIYGDHLERDIQREAADKFEVAYNKPQETIRHKRAPNGHFSKNNKTTL